MFHKTWNGRFIGITSALCMGVKICWQKLKSHLTTLLFVSNVKQHGKGIRILPGASCRYPSRIRIGDDCIIGKDTFFSSELGEYGGELVLETDVSIGNQCKIDFSGGIRIGESSHIAHEVMVLTHDHGYNYRNKPIGKPLVIGRNVFIGSRSTILHNCNYIGDNAIIGVGSVVTQDVPDNAIVAGNPARIIKYNAENLNKTR